MDKRQVEIDRVDEILNYAIENELPLSTYLVDNGVRTAGLKVDNGEMGSNGRTKAENRQYARERHSMYPWLRHYYKARERCLTNKNYKDKELNITREEIKKLWERDKAQELKRPSLDRIDNSKGYFFDNCKFIELKENKSKDRRKPVIVKDEEGNMLGWFRSAKDAGDVCNCSASNILKCCLGRRTFHAGFHWEYGKPINYSEVNNENL